MPFILYAFECAFCRCRCWRKYLLTNILFGANRVLMQRTWKFNKVHILIHRHTALFVGVCEPMWSGPDNKGDKWQQTLLSTFLPPMSLNENFPVKFAMCVGAFVHVPVWSNHQKNRFNWSYRLCSIFVHLIHIHILFDKCLIHDTQNTLLL